MKTKGLDKVGFMTGKVFDPETNNLTKLGKYLTVQKIDCYFTKKEGIYGFFPTLQNKKYDEEVYLKENSFYKDFKNNFLDKLKIREINKGDQILHQEIKFSKGEIIKSISVCYDEEGKKITAIRISTNKSKYTLGKSGDLNNKAFTTLQKVENFITGFKTSYIQDKDVCYLSFIQVYFEKEVNLPQYFAIPKEGWFQTALNKFELKVYSIFSFLFKMGLFIFIIMFPVIFYYSKSQNLYGGEIIVPNTAKSIIDSIKIHTDENGFFHVKANSREDGYFSMGFLHAKERLWQMDFLRRSARGKLSQIFGKVTLPVDKFMRSLGLNEISRKFSLEIDKSSKTFSYLDSYIKGVNFYANNFILPVEHQMIRAAWKDWSLEDTMAVANLMSLTLTHDWNLEVWYTFMESTLGKDFADIIVSYRDHNYPFWNETIINDEELRLTKNYKISEPVKDNKIADSKPNSESKLKYVKEDGSELGIDLLHNQGASNSWVISGNLTESGYPHLSNDPHLSNALPNILFTSKLYLPDETLVGSSMPGLPFFMFAGNDHLSWGFTTENSDSADICEEKIEDGFFFKDDKKIKLKVVKEIIKIKSSEPEVLEVSWTENGPLLSSSFPKEFLVINTKLEQNIPISFRPSFYKFKISTDLLFSLNHAKSPSEFRMNLDKHKMMNLNLVYATKEGEIGWTPIGNFPIKNYKNRFCRGYDSKDDVLKYIQREELPSLTNPRKGFIVTANNRPASIDNYKYETYGFYNNVRAFRIRTLIEKKIQKNEKFKIEDSIEIMSDLKDELAEHMLTRILEIVRRNSKSKLPKYYEELKNWNFTMVKESPIPTIYSVLELYLGKTLLRNKIGEVEAKGIMSMLHYWNFISGIIEKIHNGEKVDLKQCAHLSGNINCEKYIVYIFNNLDKYLIESEVKDKQGRIKNWGEIMYNHNPHMPFDKIPLLNKVFSRTIPTGGNRNTVKIARGPFNSDRNIFLSTHSARFKTVYDLESPTKPYVMMEGGNSGSVLSRFYDNLFEDSENTRLIKFEDVDFSRLAFPSESNMLLRNPTKTKKN